MAPLEARLVDSDSADGGMAYLLSGDFHVMVNNAPESGVLLPHQPGHGGHGHALHQGQHHRLEQEREPAPGPGPRDLHQLHPAGLTGDTWDPGVQIGLMLEEVEMPPRLLGRVVGRAAPPPPNPKLPDHPAPRRSPTPPSPIQNSEEPILSSFEFPGSLSYGASRQDPPPPHAVRCRFDGQRSFSPSPGTVACGVRWKARGWLSPVAGRDSGVHRSRFVLRSRAGTILLSGAPGPIASFGSPGGIAYFVGLGPGGPAQNFNGCSPLNR